MPDESGPSVGWSTLLGMGSVVAAVLLVGLGLGWLADSFAHTEPIFLLVGLLIGIAGAVIYTVVAFRKYLKH